MRLSINAPVQSEARPAPDDFVGEGAAKERSLSPSFSFLVQMARRQPRLTAQDEIDLSARIQQGCQHSLHQLVCSNILLAIKVSKRYLHPGVDRMDIIQDGVMGLYRAAEKYDGRRGFRFSTYADWWIKQVIQRNIYNYRRPLNVPESFEVHLRFAERSAKALSRQGQKLTLEHLMAKGKMTLENAREVMAFNEGSVSLQAGDDQPLEGLVTSNLPATEHEAVRDNTRLNLQQIMRSALTEREYAVLTLRYGLGVGDGRTQLKVSQLLSLSKHGVHLIERRALKKVREFIEARGYARADLLSFFDEAGAIRLATS